MQGYESIGSVGGLRVAGWVSMGAQTGEFQFNATKPVSASLFRFSKSNRNGQSLSAFGEMRQGDRIVVAGDSDPVKYVCANVDGVSDRRFFWETFVTDVMAMGPDFLPGEKITVTLIRRSAARTIEGILTVQDFSFKVADILTGADGSGGWNILFGEDGSILCGPIIFPRHAILFNENGQVLMI